MRTAGQLVLAFIVSALVTAGLISALMAARPHISRLLSAYAGKVRPAADTPDAPERLAAAGHLREAQDAYLTFLHNHPGDPAAMQGLAAVRRSVARGDTALLRNQATTYRHLAARHADTPEHYSAASMELLATASLQAAAAIEGDRTAARARRASPPADTARQAPPRGPRPRRNAAVASPALVPAGAPKSPKTPSPNPPPELAPSAPKTAARSDMSPAQPDAAGSKAPSTPAAPQDATVAVVSPPSEPSTIQSQGDLAKVDCQQGTFVLHGSGGDEEYGTGAGTTIYVRGATSERLPDLCGLEAHLGQTAIVWSHMQGDRRIATSVSVVSPAEHGGS